MQNKIKVLVASSAMFSSLLLAGVASAQTPPVTQGEVGRAEGHMGGRGMGMMGTCSWRLWDRYGN